MHRAHAPSTRRLPPGASPIEMKGAHGPGAAKGDLVVRRLWSVLCPVVAIGQANFWLYRGRNLIVP